MRVIVFGAILLHGTEKNIRIGGQCTPRGTWVARRIVAVPIHIMAPASKNDVGLRFSVAIQQIHIIVE